MAAWNSRLGTFHPHLVSRYLRGDKTLDNIERVAAAHLLEFSGWRYQEVSEETIQDIETLEVLMLMTVEGNGMHRLKEIINEA